MRTQSYTYNVSRRNEDLPQLIEEYSEYQTVFWACSADICPTFGIIF